MKLTAASYPAFDDDKVSSPTVRDALVDLYKGLAPLVEEYNAQAKTKKERIEELTLESPDLRKVLDWHEAQKLGREAAGAALVTPPPDPQA